MFCKIGVLRSFAKFTGKHRCQSLFFIKVANLRPGNFFKKRLWQRRFPPNFSKFLRTSFIIEHVWWLLLKDKMLQWRIQRLLDAGIHVWAPKLGAQIKRELMQNNISHCQQRGWKGQRGGMPAGGMELSPPPRPPLQHLLS